MKRHALVDTSVAVAVLVADHEAHAGTVEAVGGMGLGLAGHAWFETYSVLTRLPAPLRRSANDVGRMLVRSFPDTRWLDAMAAGNLAERLPGLGIAGGAVYDALVGIVAATAASKLYTRDGRALAVYRALDVDAVLLA